MSEGVELWRGDALDVSGRDDGVGNHAARAGAVGVGAAERAATRVLVRDVLRKNAVSIHEQSKRMGGPTLKTFRTVVVWKPGERSIFHLIRVKRHIPS